MSKQLSEECSKAIQESLPMKDGVPYYLDQWKGAKEALTNPSIYTKADLVSKDDALEIAKLYSKLGYGETELSAEELYTLYINQKKVK